MPCCVWERDLSCNYRADFAIRMHRKKNAKVDKRKIIKRKYATCEFTEARECAEKRVVESV